MKEFKETRLVTEKPWSSNYQTNENTVLNRGANLKEVFESL
jgi:hypothetical protein